MMPDTGSAGWNIGEGQATGAGDGSWLTLRLAFRQPFGGMELLAFLALRAIPGVESVAGNRYTRTVRAPGGPGLIELTVPEGAGPVMLRLRPAGGLDVAQALSRCRRLLDLDADPEVVDAALGADEVLAPLVAARPGLRVPGAWDGFELAVRAVLGQQVSVRAASTLAGRLAARFGASVPSGIGGTGRPPATGAAQVPPGAPPALLFPRPADLAGADLSGIGLTTARQRTLRALAGAAASGRLVLDRGADPGEAAAVLAELPGIGPWTVSYVLMRAMGDPDAFPAADLGLRRAMARLGCPAQHAGRWRPWRAYAAMHLWHAIGGTPASAPPAAGHGQNGNQAT